MKLNGSHDYAPWVQLFLDDVLEENAIEADDGAGSVVRLIPNGAGGFLAGTDGAEFATEEVSGRVRFALRPDAPPPVLDWFQQQAALVV